MCLREVVFFAAGSTVSYNLLFLTLVSFIVYPSFLILLLLLLLLPFIQGANDTKREVVSGTKLVLQLHRLD